MQTEKEREVRIRILLRLQIALLGEVRPSLRGVAASWNDSEIRVKMIYDGRGSPPELGVS